MVRRIGPNYGSQVPRKWFKAENRLEGHHINSEDLDEEYIEDSFNDLVDIEKTKKSDASVSQQAAKAYNDLTPNGDFILYKCHMYDGNGELMDRPTEIILMTEDEEDFTQKVFSVDENDITTKRTKSNYDDSIGNMKVKIQSIQGEAHGYAHRTNYGQDNPLTINDTDDIIKDILKDRDNFDWNVENDTRPWTSKMNLNPADFYHLAPEGEIILEEHYQPVKLEEETGFKLEKNIDKLKELAIYMDQFKDMIDTIIGGYEVESKGMKHLSNRNYEQLSEKTEGISPKGLEKMIETFPEKMDELYNEVK
jgi:hypothetical protein